ncbi:hypothetical protein [Amycolatopsis sp. NPDC051102]|uniref:hypothetical protein n=1 Tax=Amycolatopsis sp. NPDC051102 TaxID=3155163 RepID=UPI003429A8D9
MTTEFVDRVRNRLAGDRGQSEPAHADDAAPASPAEAPTQLPFSASGNPWHPRAGTRVTAGATPNPIQAVSS